MHERLKLKVQERNFKVDKKGTCFNLNKENNVRVYLLILRIFKNNPLIIYRIFSLTFAGF